MRLNYKNRYGVVSFLVILFMTLVLPAIKVEAATPITIRSVDYATMQVTSDYTSNFLVNGTYKLVGEDRNDFGTNDDERLHFTLDGKAEGECTPKIIIRADHDTGIPDTDNADVDVKKKDDNGGTACTNIDRDNIRVDNINVGKLIFFNWVDKDTLEPVGKLPYDTGDSVGFATHEDHLKLRNPDYVLERQANGTFTDAATNPRCATYLDKFNGIESATFHAWSRGGSGGCEDDYHTSFVVHFGNQLNATKAVGNVSNPSATSSGSIVNQKQCEDQGGLAWIFCGLIRLIDKTISELNEQVMGLLTVKDGDYNSPALKTTWGRFRNLAYLILVPMILVMVIGTALQFGPFDAYGVRKALPRMIAAIIFIALSWPICQFLIQVSNILGTGIMGLLTATFTNEDGFIGLGDFFGTGRAIFTDLTIGVGLAGAALTGAVSLGIVASFALVTLVGLLIGYLILTLRLFIIILLVIISPVAILPWIFPGNDKLWKLWRSTFIGLLMLFPLIELLIGGGQVFASVVYASSRNDIVQFIMILIALIAPFYLIPTTFKFAGGALTSLAGMVNDRSRGIFDRQRKYRQETRQALKQRASIGQRFNPNGRLGRFNRVASDLADPLSYAKIKLGTQGGRGLLSEIDASKFQQTQALSEALQKSGITNSEALKVLAGQNAAVGSVKSLSDIDKAIDILSKSDKQAERIAAGQLNNARSFITSMYKNPDLNRGNLEGAALMAWSAQGFAGAEDIAAVTNRLSGSGASAGFASSVANQATFLGYKAGGRVELKPTYGVEAQYDSAGNVKFSTGLAMPTKTADMSDQEFNTQVDKVVQRQQALVKGLKMQDITGAKGDAIDGIKYGMKRFIEEGAVAASNIKIAQQSGEWDRMSEADKDSLISAKNMGESMMEIVVQQTSPYSYLDADSRTKYKAIRDELRNSGILSADEQQRMEREIQRQRETEDPNALRPPQPPEDH